MADIIESLADLIESLVYTYFSSNISWRVTKMSILNEERTKHNSPPARSDIKIIFLSSYLHVYIIHFQIEGFILDITLKVRAFATKKKKQNKGQLPLLSRSQVYFYMLYSCWKPLNIVIFEPNKKLDSFNCSSSLITFKILPQCVWTTVVWLTQVTQTRP